MSSPIAQTQCNLCGSQRYYLLFRRKQRPGEKPPAGYTISEQSPAKPTKVVRCLGCGFVWAIQPDVSADQIRRDYSDMEDDGYIKEEAGRRAQARAILSRILKIKKGGRLLDIGCGPGFFLEEARRCGFQAEGVDLSHWSAEYARAHFGIPVFEGALEQAPFAPKSFDVITFNDVLEHVEDPKAFLTAVRRLLKNDGILYVSTPDIDSLVSRLLRGSWWGINKYHLSYFSRRTLKAMMRQTGLKPVAYFAYPRIFSLEYWAHRLQDYPTMLAWPFKLLMRIGFLKKIRLNIKLHDQISVIAVKTRRLETIAEDEADAPAPAVTKKKITVVLPAYNAETTLERTVRDIPRELVDEIILVDDASRDRTVQTAEKLGLVVFRHEKNSGYGANQKTCYQKALSRGADIVVMCHPDYQYDPTLIPQLVEPLLKGQAEAVFGSRMMKGGALEGGMPLWKHNANILLTAFENVMLGTYLTEYHSGFRAYSRRYLETVRFTENSDGFIFDTEIIAQGIANRLKIEEVPIRTRYFEEASSIKLIPSLAYGIGIIRVMVRFFLDRRGILRDPRLKRADRLNAPI